MKNEKLKIDPVRSLALKEENLANRIYLIRGEKVMLDFDLAMLYETETRTLIPNRHQISQFNVDKVIG